MVFLLQQNKLSKFKPIEEFLSHHSPTTKINFKHYNQGQCVWQPAEYYSEYYGCLGKKMRPFVWDLGNWFRRESKITLDNYY